MLLKGYVGQGLCTLTGEESNVAPAGIGSGDLGLPLREIPGSQAYDLLTPRLSRGQW